MLSAIVSTERRGDESRWADLISCVCHSSFQPTSICAVSLCQPAHWGQKDKEKEVDPVVWHYLLVRAGQEASVAW